MEPITHPIPQSQAAKLLGVAPAKLIQFRPQLRSPEDWYQDASSNRILYTPQGLKQLIQAGFGDPKLLTLLPQTSAIVPSPSQPLYRESAQPCQSAPPAPLIEYEPVDYPYPMQSDDTAHIHSGSRIDREMQVANPHDSFSPPAGGLHGRDILIVNGDINYHHSSIKEGQKAEGFTLTRRQYEMGMYALVAVVFLACLMAVVNMFRPTVTIQGGQDAPVFLR